MNRQVKFRYWWVNAKKMESWTDMLEWDRMRVYFTDDFEFPGVLMRFTGLKDKNGKDVFEGDIVAVFDGEEQTGVYEIEYCGDRNYPAFDFKGWDGETNGLCEAKEVFDLEVIGNIYESSDLLNDRVCKKCGGTGEVLVEYGAGDDFHQSSERCECRTHDEADMTGATPGDR